VYLFVRAHPKHFPSCVANQVGGFTSPTPCVEVGYARSRLPVPWSRACVVVAVGGVAAQEVRGFVDSENERAWRGAVSR
jgi:putative transposase